MSADWVACEVYWGSHGCRLEGGHKGPHLCECCRCTVHRAGLCCVGAPPYYGPTTRFYGNDAPRLGLPLVKDWPVKIGTDEWHAEAFREWLAASKAEELRYEQDCTCATTNYGTSAQGTCSGHITKDGRSWPDEWISSGPIPFERGGKRA